MNSSEKSMHVNGDYVKSKGIALNFGLPTDPPPRAVGLILQEQFDSEGDTIWALSGRGAPVLTYSISEIDYVIRERLTLAERIALDERPTCSPRALVQRLGPHDSIPDEREETPALQVAGKAADDVVEQLAMDANVAGDQPFTPAANHPWRRNPELRFKTKKEVAA